MNNKRQRNKLFTMLLLVMALLIPLNGGHKLQPHQKRVTELQTILTLSPMLRNWHGSASR